MGFRETLQKRWEKLEGPDGAKAVDGFLRAVTARDKRMKSLFHHFANLTFRCVFKGAGERVGRFAVLNRNMGERHGFLDEPEKGIESGTVGGRDEGLLQQGMLSVQPIKHFVVLGHWLPQKHALGVRLWRQLCAPVRIDPLRVAPRALTNPPQIVTQCRRGQGARLRNINRPIVIECVWHFDADARQFVMFLLRLAESQPVARHEQTAIAVNVEALMSVPTSRPGGGLVLRLWELGMMRQDKRFDINDSAAQFEPCYRQNLGGRLTRKKWIPSFNWPLI